MIRSDPSPSVLFFSSSFVLDSLGSRRGMIGDDVDRGRGALLVTSQVRRHYCGIVHTARGRV